MSSIAINSQAAVRLISWRIPSRTFNHLHRWLNVQRQHFNLSLWLIQSRAVQCLLSLNKPHIPNVIFPGNIPVLQSSIGSAIWERRTCHVSKRWDLKTMSSNWHSIVSLPASSVSVSNDGKSWVWVVPQQNRDRELWAYSVFKMSCNLM